MAVVDIPAGVKPPVIQFETAFDKEADEVFLILLGDGGKANLLLVVAAKLGRG
ncbi:MAG: hypothetical protein BWY71_02372 [Planctomycetes bacterium ADurb.Bin412]|nr:MAG: hypothetical protein BWY71_02372 [Planctomycetes bacterium ADurb.Bin412]